MPMVFDSPYALHAAMPSSRRGLSQTLFSEADALRQLCFGCSQTG